GLHRLRGVIDDAHVMLDWKHITAALATEAPRWEPGSRYGYHGITYGFLVGEVIRRVAGSTVHEVVQREIVEPLDLDGMFIATPPDARHRLARLIMSFGDPQRTERVSRRLERVAWLRPAVETFMVLDFDRLLLGDRVHQPELPALNVCFTARSLARMYAALAGGGHLDGI